MPTTQWAEPTSPAALLSETRTGILANSYLSRSLARKARTNPPSSPLSIGPGTPKQAASIAQVATQKIASDIFETLKSRVA
jgi:hypothetical protein